MICTLLRKPLNRVGILSTLPCACLNIESSRVPIEPEDLRKTPRPLSTGKIVQQVEGVINWNKAVSRSDNFLRGRFPANLIFSPESAQDLDAAVGWVHGRGNVSPTVEGSGNKVVSFTSRTVNLNPLFDAGGLPSRFFRVVTVHQLNPSLPVP